MFNEVNDVGILFGTSYIIEKYTKTREILHRNLRLKGSLFSKALFQLLLLLLREYKIGILAKIMQIPEYLLELLVSSYKNCGICFICVEYTNNIKKHLNDAHFLVQNLQDKYIGIFSNSSFYFMPNHYITLHEETNKDKNNSELDPITSTISIDDAFKNREEFQFPIAENSEKYQCNICKKTIPLSNKSNHIHSHKRNIITNCPVCFKEIKKRYLKKHREDCMNKKLSNLL